MNGLCIKSFCVKGIFNLILFHAIIRNTIKDACQANLIHTTLKSLHLSISHWLQNGWSFCITFTWFTAADIEWEWENETMLFQWKVMTVYWTDLVCLGLPNCETAVDTQVNKKCLKLVSGVLKKNPHSSGENSNLFILGCANSPGR